MENNTEEREYQYYIPDNVGFNISFRGIPARNICEAVGLIVVWGLIQKNIPFMPIIHVGIIMFCLLPLVLWFIFVENGESRLQFIFAWMRHKVRRRTCRLHIVGRHVVTDNGGDKSRQILKEFPRRLNRLFRGVE